MSWSYSIMQGLNSDSDHLARSMLGPGGLTESFRDVSPEFDPKKTTARNCLMVCYSRSLSNAHECVSIRDRIRRPELSKDGRDNIQPGRNQA
jgi:hypothetical protein